MNLLSLVPGSRNSTFTMPVKATLFKKFNSRFATGVFWTMLGTAIARGGTLLASLFLARVLGKNLFGEIGVLESSVAMFAIFSNMGLSVTATKFVAKYHLKDPGKASRILTLCILFALGAGLAVAGVMYLSASSLATGSLAAPHLQRYLQWLAGILVFSAVNGTLSGALAGLQAFRTIAKVNLLASLISTPLLMGMAYWYGVSGVVGALVSTQVIYLLLYMGALRKVASDFQISFSLQGCWGERRVLSGFSFPILLNGLMHSPVNWLCIALLVNTVNGYSEMGILNVINIWFLSMLFLPGQLAQVYFPMLEQALSEGRTNEARKLLWKTVRLNALVCITVAGVITFFADTILLGYGPEYLDAKPVLILVVWTAVIAAIQQPFVILLVVRSKTWLVLCCSIAWATATFGISYALVEQGAMGITIARFCGYLFYALISLWCGTRLLSKFSSTQDSNDHFEDDQKESTDLLAA